MWDLIKQNLSSPDDDPAETSLACVLSKNRTFEINVDEKLSPTSINTARLRVGKQVNIVDRFGVPPAIVWLLLAPVVIN
jgi:hypothetical protein